MCYFSWYDHKGGNAVTLETMLKALHYRKAVEEAVKASIRKNTSRISELA